MRTLLTNATLIDGVRPQAVPGQWVLLDEGRIRDLGAMAALPAVGDAKTIDLAGEHLMPGLWDVHVHPDFLSLHDVPLTEQTTRFGHPQ